MSKQTQYRLKDAIDSGIIAHMGFMRFINVGFIQSYDSATQRASVVMAFRKISSNNTVTDPVVISNVPVFVLSGGQSAITLPISVGDSCLLVFNDQSLDAWKNSAGDLVAPTGTNAAGFSAHNITDAIALVGVNPFATAKAGNGNLSITNGQSSLQLSESSVAIGALGIELFSTTASALSQLSTALTALATSNPTVAAVLLPIATTLNGYSLALNSIAGTL